MFRCLIFAVTALAMLAPAIPVAADQTFTIQLDPPQKEAKTSLQLKHETLGATKSASDGRYRAQVNNGGNSSAGKEASVGRVGVITASRADIKSVPSSNGATLFTCPKDTYVAIIGHCGNWYGVLMVDSSTGWVEKSRVNMLDYQVVGQTSQNADTGTRIVNTALKYLGIPYRWGGYSVQGIDCSGFVKAIYASQGVNLPRVARDQAQVGTTVGLKELQPGDRLYFACKGEQVDHTGIYMGNGYFIHSSTSRGGVAVDSLYKPLFMRSLVVARRS